MILVSKQLVRNILMGKYVGWEELQVALLEMKLHVSMDELIRSELVCTACGPGANSHNIVRVLDMSGIRALDASKRLGA